MSPARPRAGVERLWYGTDAAARAARGALLPIAGLWAGGMALRALPYRAGLRQARQCGVPTIAIGNLTVGGTGKTPLASWMAAWCLARGLRPGIVLRGYRGDDEARVHRERTPDALVITSPDRRRGADEAIRAGADLVILDDAFQRLDIARDLNVAILSPEQDHEPRWRLPAGPWREGMRALRRADLVVVLRKSAPFAAAQAMAKVSQRWHTAPVAMGALGLGRLVGLRSGTVTAPGGVAGRRVLAVSGIAQPGTFHEQLAANGASVEPCVWPDHHRFTAAEAADLAARAGRDGLVVMTQKDAVKLRALWPAGAPEPMVALLELSWEFGADTVLRVLEQATRTLNPPPHP